MLLKVLRLLACEVSAIELQMLFWFPCEIQTWGASRSQCGVWKRRGGFQPLAVKQRQQTQSEVVLFLSVWRLSVKCIVVWSHEFTWDQSYRCGRYWCDPLLLSDSFFNACRFSATWETSSSSSSTSPSFSSLPSQVSGRRRSSEMLETVWGVI